LSPAAQALYRRLTREYAITDAGGLAILHSALVSLDGALRAGETIAKDGMSFADRFNQRTAHPLLPVARDCRAAYVAGLRALNLAIGDPTAPGRPESS